MVGTDKGVPVGSSALAVDDDVVTTVLSDGWEPEPGDVGIYKIQSGNHSLLETPAHTHRIPARRYHFALTLKYRSLRSNRPSIRQGYKRSQKGRQHVVWK
jgi:hypothetical protein